MLRSSPRSTPHCAPKASRPVSQRTCAKVKMPAIQALLLQIWRDVSVAERFKLQFIVLIITQHMHDLQALCRTAVHADERGIAWRSIAAKQVASRFGDDDSFSPPPNCLLSLVSNWIPTTHVLVPCNTAYSKSRQFAANDVRCLYFWTGCDSGPMAAVHNGTRQARDWPDTMTRPRRRTLLLQA